MSLPLLPWYFFLHILLVITILILKVNKVEYYKHCSLYYSIPGTCVCIYMYVCMVITYSKSKDQPGKVANPARGQLRTGKMKNSLSAFAPENLVSRDGFGSPVPRQPAHLHTHAESGVYLRDSS